MANNIDAIIQARLGSSRLPNKVLLDIQGRSLLGHCIDRLKQISTINRIIVATTSETIDNPIKEFCSEEKILCYRGSVDNVLNRFLSASLKYKSDHFLRICSDNPFIDIGLVKAQISAFEPDDDYCSYYTRSDENALLKPVGFFVEAVKRKALEKVAKKGNSDPRIQEHVTYYIYNNPTDFRIKKLPIPTYINPELRFTIDYPDDFLIAEYILKKINKPNARSIMNLVQQDRKLNQMINNISIVYPKKY